MGPALLYREPELSTYPRETVDTLRTFALSKKTSGVDHPLDVLEGSSLKGTALTAANARVLTLLFPEVEAVREQQDVITACATVEDAAVACIVEDKAHPGRRNRPGTDRHGADIKRVTAWASKRAISILADDRGTAEYQERQEEYKVLTELIRLSRGKILALPLKGRYGVLGQYQDEVVDALAGIMKSNHVPEEEVVRVKELLRLAPLLAVDIYAQVVCQTYRADADQLFDRARLEHYRRVAESAKDYVFDFAASQFQWAQERVLELLQR